MARPAHAAAPAAAPLASTTPAAATAVPDAPAQDPRVTAVLAVLRGAPIEAAARTWAVDPPLLTRWVAAFVDAGTAKVVNRPDPDEARQRDRFLAAFAYEVRAPLAVALGWVGLLTDDDAPASSHVETAGRLEAALGELSERVADAELLVTAALGGLRVDHQRLSVGSLLAGLPELPSDVAVDGLGRDHVLHVDRLLFGRIVRDLWRAAELAPAPRARRIVVRVEEPWVELRVERHGDPIPIEVLQVLYEPFQADHLTTGVTTGLYLARALTVAHGGSMGVDQDDLGAALWVRVPIRPTPTSTP